MMKKKKERDSSASESEMSNSANRIDGSASYSVTSVSWRLASLSLRLLYLTAISHTGQRTPYISQYSNPHTTNCLAGAHC